MSGAGNSDAGWRSAGGCAGGRSSLIWAEVEDDVVGACGGADADAGAGVDFVGGDGSGISKDTDFFDFWVLSSAAGVEACASSFGVSSSILALRRNLSRREEPIDDISSSRSCSICASDIDANCRRFSASIVFLSSSGVGAVCVVEGSAVDGAGLGTSGASGLSSLRCLNADGFALRRCCGKPKPEGGFGAGGTAADGARSWISPMREKAGGGEGSTGIVGWSSSRSTTKRSPGKAMMVV